MKKRNIIFPTKNSEYNSYVVNVVPYLDSNKSRLGVTGDNITTIESILTKWNTNYALSDDANTNTKTTRNLRDTARKDMTKTLQSIYADISRSVLTAEDYNTLRISPRNTKPSPVPPPEIAPVVTVSKIIHLQHTVRCVNPETPKSSAKPDGVKSIQLLCAVVTVGTTPADDAYLVVANSGRGIIRVSFSSNKVGKVAFYKAVYVGNRGAVGPNSAVISGVIA